MKYFFVCVVAGCQLLSAVASAQTGVPVKTLVPDFRIDGAREELNNILGILPQGRGDIVVLLEDEMFGRLYSEKGILKKKFLKRGSGPGEARAPFISGMVADTIWIYDDDLGRYSLLKSNGELLRSWPQQPVGAWQDESPERRLLRYVRPVALLPNNVAIGQIGSTASAMASGEVTTYPIVRMSWGGVVGTVINRNPLAARAMVIRTANRTSYGQQPFDNAPEFGVSPDAKRIVIADAKTSEKEAFFYLTHISIKGDTLLRVKVPYTPEPLTARTIDSTVSANSRNSKEIETQYRAVLYTAPNWPAVLKVLVANDGTAWLQMHTNNGTRQWVVVSPQGKVTMKVELPKRIRLLRIDHGIWGTELDDDDVPSVVRYKIGS